MTRRVWILWLMLALLPWRGWAASVDPTAATASHGVAVAEAAAQDDMPLPCAHPASPCHDHAASSATSSHAGCAAQCDLCHGAAAIPGGVLHAAAVMPRVEPAPHVARDTGREPAGGLDRPPRLTLA